MIACWRDRVEVTIGELTDRMELARHGAHTFWGLLTSTAATIAAHALLRASLTDLDVVWINPHEAPQRVGEPRRPSPMRTAARTASRSRRKGRATPTSAA